MGFSCRKYTKERWIKTCELVKEEANLRLRDCEKPSPITGTKIMSDEWCKATYEYREEAHGQCFGNKY